MRLAAVLALALLTGSAYAAGARKTRVVACQNFNEFHDLNGATLGICGAKSPNGKPVYLASYQIVSVVNPATDKAERLMVGFQ